MKVFAVLRAPGAYFSEELLTKLGIQPGVPPTPKVIRVEVHLMYRNGHGCSPAVIPLRGPLKGHDLALCGPEIEIEC